MSPVNTEPWLWWKHGVIYHIYPRSFMDSDGDGVGDIPGIISKLDYLVNLGVDGIWLSPVFVSPMIDYGYDVKDYRGIDPVFGTMEDFKLLLEKAHAKGIRVILDMIMNHTSREHAWFQESRSSLSDSKRDWYIWRNGNDRKPPTNWRSASGGSAWEFDKTTGQYYLHSFFKEQPDLNWRCPELKQAFFEELKFWLDMGVDGFRLDVINMIAKDKHFRDNPNIFPLSFLQKDKYSRNRRKSHRIVSDLRKLLDQYQDRVSIGEIYTMPPGNPRLSASYLANGSNGIHMAFDFSLLFSSWNARKYYKSVSGWYNHIPEGGWPCNVLSNHDLFRSSNRFRWRRHKEEKARVEAVLLLTLKGTPFIYYGEEIGMQNGRLRLKDLRDPLGKKFWPFFSGRDKARTPMQWNPEENAGFTSGNPWLPLNPNYRRCNVEIQNTQEESLLENYRSLIRLRKGSRALNSGGWLPQINGQRGLLAYTRFSGDELILVILNFSGRSKPLPMLGIWSGIVLFSTHRAPDYKYYFGDMKLFPFEASVFRITSEAGLI